MSKPASNNIIDGLLECTVAIKVPDDPNETMSFLVQLAETVPNLRWNDRSRLPSFCPHQLSQINPSYFHCIPGGGLMWDSRSWLENSVKPQIELFVDADEVFFELPDLSDFLNDLL